VSDVKDMIEKAGGKGWQERHEEERDARIELLKSQKAMADAYVAGTEIHRADRQAFERAYISSLDKNTEALVRIAEALERNGGERP
jgi:hypothetical protein